MNKIISKFSVFFENPFWIGIIECQYKGTLEVCKITFGAEPKDIQIYEYILKNWNTLKFAQSLDVDIKTEKHINPKRMQRDIKKQLSSNIYIGTKSQQALKLEHENLKKERKSNRREKRELDKKYQFELKQQKHKEKHKGH